MFMCLRFHFFTDEISDHVPEHPVFLSRIGDIERGTHDTAGRRVRMRIISIRE